MTKKDNQSGMKPWLVVLIALLDDIAVLALIILVLWIFKVKIPVAVLVPLVIVIGAFVFLVHRAVVPSLRRRKETGSEGMIGLTGEVTEALGPKGVIKVQNEYWQARCDDDRIEVGEDVEITGIDRLILEVKRKA